MENFSPYFHLSRNPTGLPSFLHICFSQPSSLEPLLCRCTMLCVLPTLACHLLPSVLVWGCHLWPLVSSLFLTICLELSGPSVFPLALNILVDLLSWSCPETRIYALHFLCIWILSCAWGFRAYACWPFALLILRKQAHIIQIQDRDKSGLVELLVGHCFKSGEYAVNILVTCL